jgi:transposase
MPHLTTEELRDWVHDASDRNSYQRRLAIWLTHEGKFHAHKIADLLQVAEPSVWKWVGEYNRQGPEGLERTGRGGRRWAFLGWTEERAMLEELHVRAASGDVLTAKQMLDHIRERTGRDVSLGYVYKVLRRHGWRKIAPRPHHVKADLAAQEAYKKTPDVAGRSGSRRSPSRSHTPPVPRRRKVRPHQ